MVFEWLYKTQKKEPEGSTQGSENTQKTFEQNVS